MAKLWTLDRLQALPMHSLEAVYRNARSSKAGEAAAVVKLVEEHGLVAQNAGRQSFRREGSRSSSVHTLSKPWSPYRQVIIETYKGASRGKRSDVRARPVAGEFYPQTLNVECSTDMRERFAVGTRFRVYAKETTSKNGEPFLYTHFSWPAEVVSDAGEEQR